MDETRQRTSRDALEDCGEERELNKKKIRRKLEEFKNLLWDCKIFKFVFLGIIKFYKVNQGILRCFGLKRCLSKNCV